MNIFSLNKTRRANGTSDRIAEFASVTFAAVRNDLRRRTSRIGHGFRRQALRIIFRTFETNQRGSTRFRSFPFETTALTEFVDQTVVRLRRRDTGQVDVVIHRRIDVRNELSVGATEREEKKNNDGEHGETRCETENSHNKIFIVFQMKFVALTDGLGILFIVFHETKYVDVDILKRNQPSEKINDNVMICLFMISMLTRTHRYRSHS